MANNESSNTEIKLIKVCFLVLKLQNIFNAHILMKCINIKQNYDFIGIF